MARVLVVDDDEFMRQILADALSGAGHAVRSAADGRQALALLEEERPDLVVTDMVLTGMTGPQLVREVRRRAPSVPVLAVSGLSPERIWPPSGEDAVPAGVAFAAKPIDWARFLRAVGALARPDPD